MLSMNKDLFDEIKLLEDDVVANEKKIKDAIIEHKRNSISKYTSTIHTDLKYLNIIVNGAPLDPLESRKVMDFVRIHYENLRRIPVHI